MTKPDHIGKYQILDELGRGGFANVYKARDPDLDRVVALKVLLPYWTQDPTFEARFRREARAAANLRYPNIVTVHDAGEADGDLYIAMEYLPGRTLQQLLQEGTLTVEQTLPILEQLAAALDYAHGRGIVHRDIKPNNVIVEETGRGVHVTLMDFGLVKALSGSSVLTSQGTLLGSPEYMAPEQADPARVDEIGPATDRYALGVVAYQMLAGRVPFPGNSPATLNAHLNLPPPAPCALNPQLPPQVEQVLLQALAKRPADRYQSAGDFAAALKQAVEAEARARQRQLEKLYAQLQTAAGKKDWTEALTLGGQIQALEPGYRDVPQLTEQAREQLRRPPSRAPVPAWVWAVGGIAIVVGLIFLGKLAFGDGGVPPPTTRTPTLTPTVTRTTPTPTFTATPTKASTPTSTATPASTPSPEPASDRPPADASLHDTWTRPTDDVTMVYVPGGTFQMGSDESDSDADGDQFPQHPVTLDAFWIDQTEVSVAQFREFVSKTGHKTEAEREGQGWAWTEETGWDWIDDADWQHPQGSDSSAQDNHPVVQISWNDAVAYCEWARARLPTEAEWEYATKGTQGYIYPWGNEFDCSHGNFDDETEIDGDIVPGGEGCDGYMQTAPVGSFPDGASWCDARDLAGNVWEWTADWYGDYPSGAQINPTGPEKGAYKVLRGGSFDHSRRLVGASHRHFCPPDGRCSDIGFRCLVQAPGR